MPPHHHQPRGVLTHKSLVNWNRCGVLHGRSRPTNTTIATPINPNRGEKNVSAAPARVSTGLWSPGLQLTPPSTSKPRHLSASAHCTEGPPPSHYASTATNTTTPRGEPNQCNVTALAKVGCCEDNQKIPADKAAYTTKPQTSPRKIPNSTYGITAERAQCVRQPLSPLPTPHKGGPEGTDLHRDTTCRVRTPQTTQSPSYHPTNKKQTKNQTNRYPQSE